MLRGDGGRRKGSASRHIHSWSSLSNASKLRGTDSLSSFLSADMELVGGHLYRVDRAVQDTERGVRQVGDCGTKSQPQLRGPWGNGRIVQTMGPQAI